MGLVALGYRSLRMHSRKVDTLWHSHILYTSLYRDFCKGVLGRFVDHEPTLPTLSAPAEICKDPDTPPPEACVCEDPDTEPVPVPGSGDEDDDDDKSVPRFFRLYRRVYGVNAPSSVWNGPADAVVADEKQKISCLAV